MAAAGNTGGGTRVFDWQGAHARLTRVLEKLEATANPPQAEVQRILSERAHRYAAPRRAEMEATFLDAIGFSIGEDRFAIELGHGAAVTPLANLTSLPGTPVFYLGLISHRGHIFPVIDPRPLLGVKRDQRCGAQYAVLLRDERSAIGFAAEEIQGIARFKGSEIAAVGAENSRLRAVQGIGPRGTMIIDAASLMQDARLLVDDQAMIAAS
jgi:chemotaxis signal transduction protein